MKGSQRKPDVDSIATMLDDALKAQRSSLRIRSACSLSRLTGARKIHRPNKKPAIAPPKWQACPIRNNPG
jgi:hypothetical protein